MSQQERYILLDQILRRIIHAFDDFANSNDKEESMLYTRWKERVGDIDSAKFKEEEILKGLAEVFQNYTDGELRDLLDSIRPRIVNQGGNDIVMKIPPSKIFKNIKEAVPQDTLVTHIVNEVLGEGLKLADYEDSLEVVYRLRYIPKFGKKREGNTIAEDEADQRIMAVGAIVKHLENKLKITLDPVQPMRSVLKRLSTEELANLHSMLPKPDELQSKSDELQFLKVLQDQISRPTETTRINQSGHDITTRVPRIETLTENPTIIKWGTEVTKLLEAEIKNRSTAQNIQMPKESKESKESKETKETTTFSTTPLLDMQTSRSNETSKLSQTIGSDTKITKDKDVDSEKDKDKGKDKDKSIKR